MSRPDPGPPPGLYASLDSLLEARQHCQELPLFSRPMRNSRQSGRQYSRLRGRGVDFDQVRAYLPGDDIRNIDWRVTARTRKVHTKVFNEERERPIFIICEQSERLFFGSQERLKSVLAADVCALIAWTALSHNDRVGGMVFDARQCHEVRPRRSRQAVLELFRQLLSANHALGQHDQDSLNDQDGRNEPLNLALRHSREVIRPGSILYLLCDHAAIEQMNQALLVPLAAHNDLVLLPLVDPLDSQLPTHGPLAFSQAQQWLTLNTSDPAIQAAYNAQFTAQQQAWQHLARRLHCSLLPMDTRLPAVEQLHNMLDPRPRRGRR